MVVRSKLANPHHRRVVEIGKRLEVLRALCQIGGDLGHGLVHQTLADRIQHGAVIPRGLRQRVVILRRPQSFESWHRPCRTICALQLFGRIGTHMDGAVFA